MTVIIQQWFPVPPLGQVPIAFLPVRIETRFGNAAGSPELWVRVFPDDIHVDSFEPALTAAESAARTAFLANPTASAWTGLAQQFGPERAAWIASTAAGTSGSKASDWTQPGTTAMLPDRFIVCAYDDQGHATRIAGANIADGLALTPSPTGGNPATDPALAWMRDFNQAVTLGMGVRVPLTPELAKNGFSRVLVLGVKSLLDPTTAATRFATALDAHHYTHGVSLLPIGTPTNNSNGVKSGYDSNDPAYATSFAIERGPALTPSADGRGNGDRVARALGIDTTHFAHIAGADGRHDDPPSAMNTMMWPATWEYYLENLVTGAVPNPTTTIPAAYSFFLNWVRARGPWPTLRVGLQPYGVLPVMWSAGYQPLKGDTLTAPLLSLLNNLRPIWRSAATSVPRVGLGSDPDATLTAILGMSPRSETYVGRTVLGPQFNEYYWRFLGRVIDLSWWTQLGTLATSSLGSLATTATPTRLGNSTYLASHFALSSTIVASPLTTAPLSDNYLTTFGGMTWEQLRAVTPPGRSVPLLWILARHAALRQYASSAYTLLGSAVSAADQLEPELVNISPVVTTPRVWDHLALTLSGGLGAVGDYLNQHKSDGPAAFVAFWKAVGTLAAMGTTDLDQVLRETLDLHSHRLDAWYTAIAAQRLDVLRRESGNASTLYLGAYGWVDDVRPQPASVTWGYVHAPSTVHARSAAVLRSGYLTHQQSGSNAAAIDLSSTRVRLAQNLLDGVRSGQALGALLGYQLERALHAATLDAFIAPFRAFAPIEGVTGDHTVDGLSLLDRRASIPWGTDTWPAVGDPTQVALDAQISTLADTVDAISDLMLAESVHQLVQGNTNRAGATVDTIGRGDAPPPVLDMTRTPRRGGMITHRLFAMLDGTMPSQWTTTPRGQGEPRLAALAASFLGSPSRVHASAQIVGPTGSVIATVTMTLADLGVGPLDLLVMPQSELQARLIRQAWSLKPSATPAGSSVNLVLTRDPAWPATTLSFGELATVVASTSALVAGARAATAVDFATTDATVDPSIDTKELQTRADQAAAALQTVITHFTDGTAADQALLDSAQFGAQNSVPSIDSTAWPAQTQSASAELAARATQLAEFDAGFSRTGAAETALRDHDVGRLQIIFGASFPVVACLTSTFAATLAPMFAASDTLVANAPLAPLTWLMRSARVRAGAGRLAEAMVHAEALASSAPLTPVVAQLPVVANDVWAALPLATGTKPADHISLVAVGQTRAVRAVLFIDEWLETVPNASETSGVTFNVNDPSACAPQAILLGVQAGSAATWTLESVEGTLLDAIDLAKLRAVDPDTLGGVGHFLPALLFPANLGNSTPDTISSDLTRAAPAPPIIIRPPISVGPPVATED